MFGPQELLSKFIRLKKKKKTPFEDLLGLDLLNVSKSERLAKAKKFLDH